MWQPLSSDPHPRSGITLNKNLLRKRFFLPWKDRCAIYVTCLATVASPTCQRCNSHINSDKNETKTIETIRAMMEFQHWSVLKVSLLLPVAKISSLLLCLKWCIFGHCLISEFRLFQSFFPSNWNREPFNRCVGFFVF